MSDTHRCSVARDARTTNGQALIPTVVWTTSFASATVEALITFLAI